MPLLRFIQLYILGPDRLTVRTGQMSLSWLLLLLFCCSVASSGLSHSSMSPFSSVMGFILCIEKFSRATDSQLNAGKRQAKAKEKAVLSFLPYYTYIVFDLGGNFGRYPNKQDTFKKDRFNRIYLFFFLISR